MILIQSLLDHNFGQKKSNPYKTQFMCIIKFLIFFIVNTITIIIVIITIIIKYQIE